MSKYIYMFFLYGIGWKDSPNSSFCFFFFCLFLFSGGWKGLKALILGGACRVVGGAEGEGWTRLGGAEG